MKQFPILRLPSLLLLAGLAAFSAGCAPKVNNGGYVKTGKIKEQIIVGQTLREEVLHKLGSPSSQSSFGEETWYYITDRKEATAFLKPDVVDREVVCIAFDKAGVVRSVEYFDEGDGKDVKLAKRITPTEGHTLGFVEQVLGNIGRFNKAGGDTIAPGRRPRSSSGY